MGSQCFFSINGSNLLILLSLLLLHRVDIVDTERKNITIIDCIHDGVRMQLITKCLLCGFQIRVAAGTCIK